MGQVPVVGTPVYFECNFYIYLVELCVQNYNCKQYLL